MKKQYNRGKIAILYHSGVGNSKMIAKKIKEKVSMYYDVDFFSLRRFLHN